MLQHDIRDISIYSEYHVKIKVRTGQYGVATPRVLRPFRWRAPGRDNSARPSDRIGVLNGVYGCGRRICPIIIRVVLIGAKLDGKKISRLYRSRETAYAGEKVATAQCRNGAPLHKPSPRLNHFLQRSAASSLAALSTCALNQ